MTMTDDDRTPTPEGFHDDIWREADELFDAMALVADDTECVKLIYATIADYVRLLEAERESHIETLHGQIDAITAGRTNAAKPKPLDLNISREWFEKRSALEGDLETGAGGSSVIAENMLPQFFLRELAIEWEADIRFNKMSDGSEPGPEVKICPREQRSRSTLEHCIDLLRKAADLADLGALADSWQPHELVVGHSYLSKNFGLVTYRGLDVYYGDKAHAFDVGRAMRYTKRLDEFLAPKGALP